MKITLLQTEKQAKENGYDHVSLRVGKGHGYRGFVSKKICMVRCFQCGLENYAMSVASGFCAFCGFSPNEEK